MSFEIAGALIGKTVDIGIDYIFSQWWITVIFIIIIISMIYVIYFITPRCFWSDI